MVMSRAYLYFFVAFVISFLGSGVNYSLAVYHVLPQIVGFVFELILIVVLGFVVFFGVYRLSKLTSTKWRLIHGAIVLVIASFISVVSIEVYLPMAVEMYHGELKCQFCP